MPVGALAAPTARLHAAFAPERLGQSTTIEFGLGISDPPDHAPSPLTAMTVRYPAGLEIALSELGTVSCSAQVLETAGPNACPANSRMGEGSVTGEIRIGSSLLQEQARISLVRAPQQDGHLAMLFYAYGDTPIILQTTFAGELLPATPPFGGSIEIHLPLVGGLPEGPHLAVVQVHITLGPAHLVYYERVNGRVLAYRPKGVRMPGRCPRGGFPFSVELGFLNGRRTIAKTAVPCPGRHRRP